MHAAETNRIAGGNVTTLTGFNEAAACTPRRPPTPNRLGLLPFWWRLRAVASITPQRDADTARCRSSVVKEPHRFRHLRHFERVRATASQQAARIASARQSPGTTSIHLYHDSPALDRGKALADAFYCQLGPFRRSHVDQQHVVLPGLYQLPQPRL